MFHALIELESAILESGSTALQRDWISLLLGSPGIHVLLGNSTCARNRELLEAQLRTLRSSTVEIELLFIPGCHFFGSNQAQVCPRSSIAHFQCE